MSEDDNGAALVLNVDDFEPGRYARSRTLQQAGFKVLEAATGNEALAMIREHRPDLVLLDINLPDISGLAVCREVKADPELASTMIVHVSATAITNADWAEALDTGADGYLMEPVDGPVLIATVRSQLRLARSERALEAANRELVRSNEDLARFAYVASHDLQEPLRTVTNFTQLLWKKYSGRLDADADQYLVFIQDAASRMTELVRDVLSYSQAGAVSRIRTTDLNQVFERTIANLQVAIEEANAQITCAPLPTVMADPVEIGRVLENLIANAIKYRSDQAPVINIAASRDRHRWVISVADNGVGFSQEHAAKVFEPFTRLQRRKSGTGIGLAIAKRIMERHRGEIWVTSQQNQGSTFYFSLPVAAAAQDA